jgi:glycerol-1-phosphatase
LLSGIEAPGGPTGESASRWPGLLDCDRPLMAAYDTAMLDLDGVVYIGGDAVAGAADHLESARRAGMQLAFVTNNASRTPDQVAERLRAVGVPAQATDVVTSAQAAARMIARLVPTGANVLVVGGEGLIAALAEHDLHAVAFADDDPAGVVSGFHPDLGWRMLAEGSIAVGRGLPWVASNTDLTLPTARGLVPGNGTFVAAITTATGRRPEVAGKPLRPLFDETVLRVGAERPLVVGDRLDTDIEGANNSAAHSLLVMTGVTDLKAVAGAPANQRPTYLSMDLGGLASSQTKVKLSAVAEAEAAASSGALVYAECGGWRSSVDEAGIVSLSGAGAADDGLRATVAVAWNWMSTCAGVDSRRADPEPDVRAVLPILGMEPSREERIR